MFLNFLKNLFERKQCMLRIPMVSDKKKLIYCCACDPVDDCCLCYKKPEPCWITDEKKPYITKKEMDKKSKEGYKFNCDTLKWEKAKINHSKKKGK